MGAHSAPESTATQTQHPWRATARTVVALLFGLTPLLPSIIETLGLDTAIPLVAGVLGVSGAVTRVLAVPGVDAVLRQYLPALAASPREEK
ncbi:hypothetical protein [Rhodococcus opacus]|uniref:Holin n=1 Tax=Rhodococcus opacus TaxID=37919 RepID=A0A2S8JAV5_RHOOP|nr:hypothetical protein [Rhodococcus opacus]PQP24174.1 hypothetical protein C5613_14940 [Rhodococcus opacus]